ncbi:MAG: hypothetical protein IJG87_08705 [Ruminococcus sp.]|nr:hypothetical protein [Ruminococcus sp.]
MKKKMRRNLFAVLAVLLTAVILFGTTASAYADVNGFRLYRGTFRYTGNEDTFYYSDGYFSISGCEKNEHLRTMSAAMAFSVFGTAPQDTLDLMTDIGMEPDSVVMEDIVWGTPDTIGTVIAKKKIKDTSLIAVAIRGNDYAGEWASNVLAGEEGDAAGFAAAAAKVSERIQTYLSENDISQAKIWVVGYSRAGGVANLVGKAMNEDPASFCTDKDNIYVYTYEAPRCSADAAVYPNIHNIFDVNDLVPHLYPENWGLHLNGVQETIGDPDDTVMAAYFNLFTQGYVKNIEERPKNEFLKSFETFLSATYSRESYAVDVQPYFSSLCEICLGKTWEQRTVLLSYLTEVGEMVKNDPDLDPIILNTLSNPTSQENIDAISELISENMNAAKETVDPPFSDEEYLTVQESVKPLVTVFLTLAEKDKTYSEINSNGKKVGYCFYHLVTLFANIKEFILPHLNTNVFELLKKQDSYYTAGVRIWPGNVSVGENCYTYAEYGGPLENMARDFGCFTEDDIAVWKNGYDLRIDTVLTEMDVETGSELWFRAAGMVDKSMNIDRFFDASMTKTVGFRTSPAGMVKLKENDCYITIPYEFAKKCYRLAVVQVTEHSAKKIDSKIVKTESGDVELHFNADVPAIYASAFDDHRWYTSGDVDRDQNVTALDVTHLQRYLVKAEAFDDFQRLAADVDGDDKATAIDVTWIQRSLVHMDVPYPIGE